MRGSILTLGAFSDKLSQIVGKYWTCIDAAFLSTARQFIRFYGDHWGSACGIRCADISLTYLVVVYGIQFVGVQLQIWRRCENVRFYAIYLIWRGLVLGCFAHLLVTWNNIST